MSVQKTQGQSIKAMKKLPCDLTLWMTIVKGQRLTQTIKLLTGYDIFRALPTNDKQRCSFQKEYLLFQARAILKHEAY